MIKMERSERQTTQVGECLIMKRILLGVRLVHLKLRRWLVVLATCNRSSQEANFFKFIL